MHTIVQANAHTSAANLFQMNGARYVFILCSFSL